MNAVSETTIANLVRNVTRDFKLAAAEQREVRAMLAGLTLRESAAAQGIRADTVRQRRRDIYRKLGVHSDARAVALVVGLQGAWPPPEIAPRVHE